MFRFFQKIRRQLAEDNKPKKYLLYAVGEILLVVIGILVALQINNWNELRKYKKLEVSTLIEIRADFAESLNDLNLMIQFNKKTFSSYLTILKCIDKKLPYNDSLEAHFGVIPNWSSPHFNFSAYETLKNRGVELISHDILKNKIIKIYEREFDYLINDYDKAEWSTSNSIIQPFFIKNFETTKIIFAKPNNYKHLITSEEFKNHITYLASLRSWGIQASEELKTKIEILMDEISSEIKYLE